MILECNIRAKFSVEGDDELPLAAYAALIDSLIESLEPRCIENEVDGDVDCIVWLNGLEVGKLRRVKE